MKTISGKNRFQFVAYMSPPPADARDGKKTFSVKNFVTEEHFGNVKMCGFNRLSAIYEHTEEQYLQSMALCDRLDLEYTVREQVEGESLRDLFRDHWETEETAAYLKKIQPQLKSRFDEYAKHPSFVGILASDEPHAGKFPALKLAQDWFERNYPGKEFEVNLLPDYANGEQLTGIKGAEKNYCKHVDDFVNIVRPKFLSYDYYPLMIDREKNEYYIRSTYLKNLEIIAKKAKEQHVPFRVFLLTLGHWSCRTVTTYEEIAWQVYTAMAYGATGAQTFTYWTMLGHKPNNPEHVTTALVGVNGELLPAWYAMREVISEVRSFEQAFLQFDWQKCLYCLSEEGRENPLFQELDRNTDDILQGVNTDADVVVGCFGRDGRRAYLVSNVSDPAYRLTAAIEIRFYGDYNVTVYQNGKKYVAVTDGNRLLLSVRSGSGAFVVLEGKR